MTRKPATNSTYLKGGVSCSKNSFVVNQTLVFQIKFSAKNPAFSKRPNGNIEKTDSLKGIGIYSTKNEQDNPLHSDNT